MSTTKRFDEICQNTRFRGFVGNVFDIVYDLVELNIRDARGRFDLPTRIQMRLMPRFIKLKDRLRQTHDTRFLAVAFAIANRHYAYGNIVGNDLRYKTHARNGTNANAEKFTFASRLKNDLAYVCIDVIAYVIFIYKHGFVWDAESVVVNALLGSYRMSNVSILHVLYTYVCVKKCTEIEITIISEKL